MFTKIKIPKNIQLSFFNKKLKIIGKLGTVDMNLPNDFSLRLNNNNLDIYSLDTKLIGTFSSLLKKNIKGVSQGFLLKLQLVGIGFKFLEAQSFLKLKLGYSHKVYCKIPSNVKINIIKPTLISLAGINFSALNQFAAELKSFKYPEVYKGKGVRFLDEKIKLKETKKK